MSDAPPAAAQPGALRPAAPRTRRLAELLDRVPGLAVRGDLAGVEVTGCTHDSRAVRPGDLYAALPGARVHGAAFAGQARAGGAVAVLTDTAGAELVEGLPVLVAEDPRAVLGEVAAWVHDDPSADLLVLGITGTNGKTTTAFLVEAGLRQAGHRTALLGTVVTRIGDDEVPSARTTPEATDLHALFAVMRERGVTAVVMEVSSHALRLGRVGGVRFAGAQFTNLSQDHLDFHVDMEDYFAAKASLFEPDHTALAVVCTGDEWGRRLASTAPVPVTTYDGLAGAWQRDAGLAQPEVDWLAADVELLPDRSTFCAISSGWLGEVEVQLPGAFNVTNALGAIALLEAVGVDAQTAAAGIAALPGVPGRMERVDAGQPWTAVVDYAHTPEAVASLLAAVREVTPGRVLVVLGCGGDRDAGKRPQMGRAALDGSDLAVLTSDNPRSEDPLTILEQMASGLPAEDLVVEPDRRAAIALAVARARPGDAVVIAGKGHETGQEVDGVVSPFDDRVVLAEAIVSARVSA